MHGSAQLFLFIRDKYPDACIVIPAKAGMTNTPQLAAEIIYLFTDVTHNKKTVLLQDIPQKTTHETASH